MRRYFIFNYHFMCTGGLSGEGSIWFEASGFPTCYAVKEAITEKVEAEFPGRTEDSNIVIRTFQEFTEKDYEAWTRKK